MSKSPEKKSAFSTEKAAELYRNWNIGAAAVTGAGIVLLPELAPVFVGLTALNIAQAGLGEAVRRMRASKSSAAETAPQAKTKTPKARVRAMPRLATA